MVTTSSFAQVSKENYKVQLKSTKFTPSEALSDFAEQPEKLQDVLFQNEYYVVLQFKNLPNQDTRNQLANSGIRLLSYVGANAYQAAVSQDITTAKMTATDLRAWAKMPMESKVSNSLREGDLPQWATQVANKIDLTIVLHEKSTNNVRNHLQSIGCELLGKALNNPKHLEVRADIEQIMTLAELPFVAHVEPIKAPDVQLNHYAVPAMRIHPVRAGFLGNQQLTGAGVIVGIGDGGYVDNHVDFESRVTNKTTLDIWGAHQYHVAGITAGTGNIDPWHQGIAYNSMLIMDITSNVIVKASTYHAQGMMATNNSYGPSSFDCASAGEYNSTSQTVDQHMLDMPELMHIIAAGNSGSVTCTGYPKSFNTVLRSYSSNKNALTVSATSHRGRTTTFSSRGPVQDGRIKPDISAPGQSIRSNGNNNDYVMISGSSMAAPAVAGVWSLMVEAYRKQFNTNPQAALLKAYMMNTANDIGNPGPDYTFGYGMPDVARAVEALRESRFFQANISNGQYDEYTINVPANAAEVRVMLYWHDKEGVLGASKALVNDLQLTVQAPNEIAYNPWILDPTPANVNNDAVRGIDNLNNVEQVTLSEEAPGEILPGTYTIRVTGAAVPEGPQEYFVVYEVVTNGVELAYPVGGETFMPGSREFFRWSAAGPGKNDVKVYYSINDGITWKEIPTNTEHVEEGYVDFTFPDDISHTGQGRVKVTINGGATSSVNQYPFTIMQQPVMEDPESCDGKIYLNWSDVKGAVAYEIMRLDTFMKPLAITNATSFVIDNQPTLGDEWYSVRPISDTNHRGVRAIAKRAVRNNLPCAELSDVRVKRIISPVSAIGREYTNSSHSPNQMITVELENKGNTAASNFDVSFALNGVTLVTDQFNGTIQPGELAEFTFGFGKDFTAPGIHELTAKTALAGDINPMNDAAPEAATLLQLANPPLNAPIEVAEDFDDLEADIIQQNKMGIGGRAFLDFQSSNPNGELVIGNDFATEGKALTLNNVADGIEAVNELIITKNLSNFSLRGAGGKIPIETIFLSFQYRNHEQELNPNNRVFVRGSENDVWIPVYNLDLEAPLSEGLFAQTGSINIGATLRDAGQDISQSFQIKFSQSGASSADDPSSADGFTFDNIQLEEGIELPVELVHFEVKKAPNQRDAIISWRTLTETNNDYFVLEMAEENVNGQIDVFNEIYRVNGAGTTIAPQDYEYLDDDPNKISTRYYRLRQVDFDGTYAYSEVKAVNFDDDGAIINVHPVPFKEEVHVTVKSRPGASLTIRVSDISGRTIQQQQSELQTEGIHKETVDMNEALPSGVYLMEVNMDGFRHNKKIVKQE